MNYFLGLGAIATFAWAASHAVLSEIEAQPVSPRSTIATAPSSHPRPDQKALEARRAPVPIERNARSSVIMPDSPKALVPPAEQKVEGEQKVQDDLDKKAAKLAVEMDGYKRVTIVGKTSSGAWRAKAYRGATEVLLIVDGTGRVVTE